MSADLSTALVALVVALTNLISIWVTHLRAQHAVKTNTAILTETVVANGTKCRDAQQAHPSVPPSPS